MTIIAAFVQQSFAENDPPDYVGFDEFIFVKFQKSISVDTLAHIGKPLESVRAEVPIDVIKDHYERLANIIENDDIPPAFYFNVDETGFQEYVDATSK